MTLPDNTTKPIECAKPAPALKLQLLSHGTPESRDLAFSRRFYEEFLGLEVVETSPISLLIRLGGPNTIAVVFSKHVGEMTSLTTIGSMSGPRKKWRASHSECQGPGDREDLKGVGRKRHNSA